MEVWGRLNKSTLLFANLSIYRKVSKKHVTLSFILSRVEGEAKSLQPFGQRFPSTCSGPAQSLTKWS